MAEKNDNPYLLNNDQVIEKAGNVAGKVGREANRALGLGVSLAKGKIPTRQEALDKGKELTGPVTKAVSAGASAIGKAASDVGTAIKKKAEGFGLGI